MRTTTLALATGVLMLSACSHQRVARDTSPGTIDLTRSHIAMGALGAAPFYTFQGVLEINGEPLVGTVPVSVRLEDAVGDILPGTEDTLEVVCDDQGRFSAQFPLSDEPLDTVGNPTLFLVLVVGEQEVELSPISIGYTPRAWSAVRASVAETAGTAVSALSASSANNANFALNAQNAVEITDVEEIVLQPFMAAGWDDFNTTIFELPRATRRGNIVILEGLVENVNNGGATVMTLPESLRPSKRLIFICSGNRSTTQNIPYRIDVDANGNVLLVRPAGTSTDDWFSLSGISYRVD